MHQILENQYVHDFVQKLLSLGRGKATELTEKYITDNCHGYTLDVGCGTGRYSHIFERDYFGIDINQRYLINSCSNGKQSICGNAVGLPFKDKSFNSIYSVGFFHHIDYANAQKCFQEIIRVGKPDANILILDTFCPDNRWDLLGNVLVKMDRGRYIRSRDNFVEELLGYFDIIDENYIKRSYPYNLYAFILKAR